MATTQGTGPGGTPASVRIAMMITGVTIALLTFGYAYHLDITKHLFVGGFSSTAFGYVLALLPGAAAVGHYLSAAYNSRQRGILRLAEFRSLRAKLSGKSEGDALVQIGESPSLAGTAVVASLFLTATFLLVAS